MNSLKLKLKISCNTCGDTLIRSKKIKVYAMTQEGAKLEAAEKVSDWKSKLQGTNCKVCQSIINEVAA